MTAPVLLEWPAGAGTLAIEVDCAEELGFEGSSEVTEHPVERGANVTDHVRPTPDVITLVGWITNQPIVPTADFPDLALRTQVATVAGRQVKFQALSAPAAMDRVRAADALLVAAQQAGQVVRLSTRFRVVEDLVITRYKVERKVEVGDALSFTMELKKLRIVETQRVAVRRPAQRRAQARQQRGAQPARPVDRRDAATRLIDSISGLNFGRLFGGA